MSKPLTDFPTICPLRYAFSLVGGRWKPAILCCLAEHSPRRYGEIQKKLQGITNVMLSQSLKELDADGLVHRQQYSQIPPKVEYSLTAAGEAAIPALRQLSEWARQHLEQEAQKNAYCQECGSTACE